MGTKWLLTATAVAFITSIGFAAAQQSPLPPAPAEKVAPPTKDLNSPASPGVTGGAVTDGAGEARKDPTKKIDEGGRAGELQENRGRSDTTGQAPFPPASRDENRAPTQKKSDQKL
jgi:hypothetical protein